MTLKPNDIVYTPCCNFNAGHLYFEQHKVIAIGEDFIELEDVARLEKRGTELIPVPCKPTRHRGDKKDKDYYSRPLAEIMQEFQDETDWFTNRLKEDERKYG
jgi:hypothetical protein